MDAGRHVDRARRGARDDLARGALERRVRLPDRFLAAQAKVLAADTAIRVTNDALQLWGAAGYSRDNPMERRVRDARMFAIAGGTAQVLRTQVAARLLGRRLPQTRDGYLAEAAAPRAAE